MMRRILLSLMLILGGSMFLMPTASVTPAAAASCTIKVDNGAGGVIELEVECSEFGGPDEQDGGGGGPRICTLNGAVIPCTSESGSWVAAYQCYVKPLSPQPPKEDPLWQGHTDGTLYWCDRAPLTDWVPVVVWMNSDPTALPDPWALARRAMSSMALTAPEIGIVPETTAGAVGIIGLPVWMWVANPGPSVTGPITRSASESGYTVTATGRVVRMVWDMGDGASVTCNGPGTPYIDAYGNSESPTCGYSYSRVGTYTVTATAYWEITWTGMGERGAFTRSFDTSVQVVEAEVQVINR